MIKYYPYKSDESNKKIIYLKTIKKGIFCQTSASDFVHKEETLSEIMNFGLDQVSTAPLRCKWLAGYCGISAIYQDIQKN